MTNLPPRVLCECLKEIFTYLLNIHPVIITIINGHYIDKLSWNILLNLTGILSYAVFLFTVEPLEVLQDLTELPLLPLSVCDDRVINTSFIDQQNSNNIKALKLINIKKLSFVYKKLKYYKNTLLIVINDYSLYDVERLICSVLNLEVCPEGVASMVHQLTGL